MIYINPPSVPPYGKCHILSEMDAHVSWNGAAHMEYKSAEVVLYFWLMMLADSIVSNCPDCFLSHQHPSQFVKRPQHPSSQHAVVLKNLPWIPLV